MSETALEHRWDSRFRRATRISRDDIEAATIGKTVSIRILSLVPVWLIATLVIAENVYWDLQEGTLFSTDRSDLVWSVILIGVAVVLGSMLRAPALVVRTRVGTSTFFLGRRERSLQRLLLAEVKKGRAPDASSSLAFRRAG